MTTYRAATGSDIALVSLTTFAPQPRSMGLQYARRSVMPDGSIVEEGPFVELIWDAIVSASELTTILTPLGLHSATSAAVTVYIRTDLYAWARYNGRAVRPPASWNNYFARGVTVIVRGLEVAS